MNNIVSGSETAIKNMLKGATLQVGIAFLKKQGRGGVI